MYSQIFKKIFRINYEAVNKIYTYSTYVKLEKWYYVKSYPSQKENKKQRGQFSLAYTMGHPAAGTYV